MHNIEYHDIGNRKPLPAWKEHIRLNPDMYIGNIGDGSLPGDGIYKMIKEVLDDALIGYESGSDRIIEVFINDRQVSVCDFYNSLPIDWLVEYVSERKRDGIGFDIKSVDQIKHYGVGLKTVNLLSSYFIAQSIKDGKSVIAEFEQGRLFNETYDEKSQQHFCSLISFVPDAEIFGTIRFNKEYIRQMIMNYMAQNEGLKIKLKS